MRFECVLVHWHWGIPQFSDPKNGPWGLWFSAAVAVNPPLGTHQLLEYDVDLEASPLERYANVYFDFLQRRGERGLKAFQETYQAETLTGNMKNGLV